MSEIILKDWYGKEQTFDHDKIFVQGTNGELVQFTQGTGEPTLETLEVTENGTYTPSDGVDGFGSVEVNVPTPEIKLQNKTITENGTYTADSGFDGLGSVTVDVAGSIDSTPKAKMAYVTVTGAYGSRVSVDFGFKPDFILIVPSKSISIGSDNFIFLGVSENFESKTGVSFSQLSMYISSGVTNRQTTGGYIDGDNANVPIYNADETGFNLGKSFISGACYIYALSL